MTPVLTVLFLGAVQGVILAGVLFSLRRGNRSANRLLALLVMFFSLNMTLHTLSDAQLVHIPHHSGLISVFFFLLGPLVYCYVNALTLQLKELRYCFGRTGYFQFLPFVIAALIYLPFYIGGFRVGIVESRFIEKILFWLMIVHALVYLLLTLRRLHIHSRELRRSFSAIGKINLYWLRFLLTVMIVLWLVSLFFKGFGAGPEAWNYNWLVVSVFIYSIGYLGLRRPEIFSGPDSGAPGKKYEKSTLTEERAEKSLRCLLQLMEKEKPFLDGNLTLAGLAELLGMTPHELSQLINQRLERSFFELVNQYRVDEAKVKMTDPAHAHLKLAAVGMMVGFNSTSSFNAAFKKHTGMTPSQFKNSV